MGERSTYVMVLLGSLVVGAALLWPRLREPDAPAEVAPPPEPPPTPPPAPSAEEPPKEPPLPSYVHLSPQSETACPEGMLLVDGVYCPFIAHRCANRASITDEECGAYAAEVLCEGTLQHRRFCIDRFEYPNLERVRPAVMVDFETAERACSVEGKRLCTAEEWEFACEGPQMWPYPYGLAEDAAQCRSAAERPDESSDASEATRDPSAASFGCVSPFGVRDLTGSVGEWVVNGNGTVSAAPFRSSAKGLPSGNTRSPERRQPRCRPLMTSRPATYRSAELGFRCCTRPKK